MSLRGSSINPDATTHLQYFLNMQSPTQASGHLKIAGLTSTSNTSSNISTVTSLDQNFPNPYNPATQIKYSIAIDGPVSLIVYDILGREVTVLENSVKQAGAYTASFDASKLSSGVYLYRLQSGSYTETRKMVVMK